MANGGTAAPLTAGHDQDTTGWHSFHLYESNLRFVLKTFKTRQAKRPQMTMQFTFDTKCNSQMEAVPASTIPSLPVEIILFILEILQAEDDGKQGLLAFRLASKDFATLAAPTLFRTLNLSRKGGTGAFVISLSKERPDLAAFVKEINFDVQQKQPDDWEDDEDDDEDYNEYDSEDSEKDIEVDTIRQSASIFSHLHLFPALETLRLRFPSSYEHRPTWLSDDDDDGGGEDDPEDFMTNVRVLQIKILTELANLPTEPNTFNTIRAFIIHGLIAQPNRSARLDRLKLFLRGITNLAISTVAASNGYVPIRRNVYTKFWTNDVPFLAASFSLTSFKLTTDFVRGTVGPCCAVWDSMDWPNLQSLSLGGIIFNDSSYDETYLLDPLSITGVEAFILYHTSLIELELQNCFLSIDIPKVPSPRMWTDILQGFEDKLVNLKKFTLCPVPCRPHHYRDADVGNSTSDNDYVTVINRKGYVHPSVFSAYDTFFHDVQTPHREDVDLDGLAFESLQASIVGRLGFPYSY